MMTESTKMYAMSFDGVLNAMKTAFDKHIPGRYFIDPVNDESCPTQAYMVDPRRLGALLGALVVWVSLREIALLRLHVVDGLLVSSVVPTNATAMHPDVQRALQVVREQDSVPFSIREEKRLTPICFYAPPAKELAYQNGFDAFAEQLDRTMSTLLDYIRRFP